MAQRTNTKIIFNIYYRAACMLIKLMKTRVTRTIKDNEIRREKKHFDFG